MAVTINGLGSVIEIAEETTYGTQVAKTVSVPFTSESLEVTPMFSESPAIRYDNVLSVESDVILTHFEAGGSIEFPLWDKGLERWMKGVYGDYTFGAGTPNTHTYLFGAQGVEHDSICADVFMGGTTTAPSKNVSGIVPVGYTVSGAVGDSAPLALSIDTLAREVTFTASDTAVGVEVATLEAFTWAGVDIALGGSTPPDPCLQGFSMTVAVPKERKFCMGSQYTDKPDRGGRAEVSGTLTFYFEDWDEANDLIQGTTQSLVITAGEVSASTNHQWQWTNNILFTGGVASLDSEDRVTVDMNWKGLSSTANDQDASGHQLVISSTTATVA